MTIRSITIIVALFLLPHSALAWRHGSASSVPTAAISCTTNGTCIGTGGGSSLFTAGTCNGSADDSAMFTSFNAFAQTWQGSHSGWIKIDFQGKTCNIASTTIACPAAPGNSKCPFISIKQLLIEGSGGGLKGQIDPSTLSVISLAGEGLYQDNLHSVRLSTSAAGDSCVTATAAAAGGTPDVTIFTVGQYAVITGFDTQGLWHAPFGFPPNPYYFEYRKVSSLNNTTKQVCFDTPLVSAYKSTWPLFNNGNAGEVDNGGPSTLYVLDPSWDTQVYYHNITLDFPIMDTLGTGLEAVGRSATFDAVATTFARCIIPSQNDTWTVLNSNLSGCTIESDKIINVIAISNTTLGEIDFQSSNGEFDLTGGTTTRVNGTPKKFVGLNASIGHLSLGVQVQGRSNSASCTGCTNIGTLDIAVTPTPIDGTWSMSGGIITIPNTDSVGLNGNQARWAVPGTNFFWRGTDETETLAQVIDVTQDATNIYIQTSLAGGFPAVAGLSSVFPHPAPQFTCSGCTGTDPQIASLAQAPAAAPLYSYQTYTYTGAVGGGAQGRFKVWGNLSQEDFDVTNAYSGAGSLSFNLSQFNNWDVILSAFSSGSYNNGAGGPSINAKSIGHRRVTPSGVTCVSGSCSGDAGLATLDASGMWFTGLPNSGPIYSADVSGSCPGAGCPSVTVTIQTNQGVVNPPN